MNSRPLTAGAARRALECYAAVAGASGSEVTRHGLRIRAALSGLRGRRLPRAELAALINAMESACEGVEPAAFTRRGDALTIELIAPRERLLAIAARLESLARLYPSGLLVFSHYALPAPRIH
ncbi:hypothetical protein J2T57_001249 [Natronocella acetinitrilica]|uniref:Uncharacterized protein n=1 Tax=Natronocella acetinitrilica TaxID=414046 RepID=A0AAE3G2D6_9GAMM|nr:hypothetical protein [Natronocella acetinitrilica]MCP1674147.1 hypothetical protein [Natronocella acetinitrilica]